MPSNEKGKAKLSEDDFEDIGVVKNLLEVQSRLRTTTDSVENPSR